MSKIRLDHDGSFIVDFIKTIDGKRIHISKKGFKTYEEAERIIPKLIEERMSKERKKRVSGTLSSFFEEYLERRSRKISPSSSLAIRGIYNSVFKQYGDMEVYDFLSINNILHLHKEIISKSNYGEKHKNRIIGELRQMVDFASLLKIISSEDASDEKMKH